MRAHHRVHVGARTDHKLRNVGMANVCGLDQPGLAGHIVAHVDRTARVDEQLRDVEEAVVTRAI